MMSNNEEDCWISAYIFFEGNIYGYECDNIIREVLIPFLEGEESQGLFERYFFVRYSEHGPHIRVRFFGNSSRLESKLKPLFEYQINQNLSEYISNAGRSDNQRSIDVGKYFIKWTIYEPEFERYGGKEAIKIAEEYFSYSSVTAIELIKLFGSNDKASKLGKGLALMVIILFKFCLQKEKAIKLIASYSSSYLQAIAKEEKYHEAWVESFNAGFNNQAEKLIEIVNTIWGILEECDELPGILDNFSKNLKIISEKLKQLCGDNQIVLKEIPINNWDVCLFSIVPSYIHMMNNRLGITIQEESYLAHLISKGILVEHPTKLQD